MKALTLHRPWPWAIIHLGKRVENRSWAPPSSLIGQRIAIHAGQRWDAAGAVWILETFQPQTIPVGQRGVIVATAVIERAARPNTVPLDQERWACGPWCWLLDDVCALAEPIPCRGAQGLWDVPEEIARRIAP